MKRFWDKVNIAGPDECWEWTAGTYLKGLKYGRFQFEGKAKSAHRVAYILTNGDIPDDMFVCHTCDNPACCNPKHLWLGSAKDNTQDMLKKGRAKNGNSVKTHCSNGHPFDKIYKVKSKRSKRERRCSLCYNAYMRIWYKKKKELAYHEFK